MLRKITLIICVLTAISWASGASRAEELLKFEAEIRENLTKPSIVAVNEMGQIFVLDAGSRVQTFSNENKSRFSFPLVAGTGASAVPFSNLSPAAFSAKGQIVAAEKAKNKVHVFSLTGEVSFSFGAQGVLPGQFMEISGVDVDVTGFIYISDRVNKRIQIFTPHGVFVRAIELSAAPFDVSVDPRGHIYALLPEIGLIERYSSSGKKLAEIISRRHSRDEIARSELFTVDPFGDIYLAQKFEGRIVKIDQEGNILVSFGSEGSGRGQFYGLSGLFADGAGSLYVADSGNARVQVFRIRPPERAPLAEARNAQFFLEFDSFIEMTPNIVDMFMRQGKGLFTLRDKSGVIRTALSAHSTIGTDGAMPGQLSRPSAIYVTLDGSMYVADTGNQRVSIFKPDGSVHYQFGRAGDKPGQFNSPQGLAVSKRGKIIVADTNNNRVQLFNHDGIYLTQIGEELSGEIEDIAAGCRPVILPRAIAVDSKDQIYILDAEKAMIKVFDEDGRCLRTIGEKGEGDGRFLRPIDITVDQNDYLYVADAANGRIHIFDPIGRFVLGFGSLGEGGGYFKELSAITANEGRIYAADYANSRVQVFRFSLDGLIGRPERLYATKTSPPPPMVDTNDVLRYSTAQQNAFRAAVRELREGMGFSEEYLMRFVRVDSVESLNDGNVKVTVSIPRFIPQEFRGAGP